MEFTVEYADYTIHHKLATPASDTSNLGDLWNQIRWFHSEEKLAAAYVEALHESQQNNQYMKVTLS